MSVDEQHLRIRRSLEEGLGVEEASYLMDRPVGGWSSLVTNHTLDLTLAVIDERFRSLEQRIDARFAAVDARFVSVEERFVSLEQRIDARFSAVDAQFASLRHELMGYMDQRFADLGWRVITAVIAGMAVMATVFAAVTGVLLALVG